MIRYNNIEFDTVSELLEYQRAVHTEEPVRDAIIDSPPHQQPQYNPHKHYSAWEIELLKEILNKNDKRFTRSVIKDACQRTGRSNHAIRLKLAKLKEGLPTKTSKKHYIKNAEILRQINRRAAQIVSQRGVSYDKARSIAFSERRAQKGVINLKSLPPIKKDSFGRFLEVLRDIHAGKYLKGFGLRDAEALFPGEWSVEKWKQLLYNLMLNAHTLRAQAGVEELKIRISSDKIFGDKNSK